MDLRLTKARISFASGLWNKSAAVVGGTLKYNCDFIVEPDTRVERKDAAGKWVKTTLEEAQRLTAVEAFKGNEKRATEWLADLEARQKSIRVGNKQRGKDGEVREGYADRTYVHATSTQAMPVYRADTTKCSSEEDCPIYSGCYVVARVSIYANLKKGAQGLFASLQGTQYHSEGDSFGGGRAAAADDFEAVTEGADASDFS